MLVILMIDVASTTQAFTKVRVRITTMRFVAYLTWRRFNGRLPSSAFMPRKAKPDRPAPQGGPRT